MSGISLEARPVLVSHARLQTDRVSGGPILLYPEGISELNETSNAILQHCDGRTTVAAMLAALAEKYEAEEGELREDVLACLEEFQRRQLLVL